MNHAEMVAFYEVAADQDATLLADIYLDFTDFGRPEFVAFTERLCAAVLLARAVVTRADEMAQQCKEDARTGGHRVPGWEGESDVMLDERRGMVETAAAIGRGAATLTAVAAFESLLEDLLPVVVAQRGGLSRKWRGVIAAYRLSDHEVAALASDIDRISSRRNTFAHRLTGSPWLNNATESTPSFSAAELDDTLHTVGRLAVALDELTDRRPQES